MILTLMLYFAEGEYIKRRVKQGKNVRCRGCRAECSTLKPSILVSVKACQGKVSVRSRSGKEVSPDDVLGREVGV